MIHYDFVTDPDDPLVTDLLTKLLNIVNNITESNLDRGLIRYVFDSDHSEILKIVNEISYIPITVSVTNENINLQATSDLVKAFAEKIIKTDISQVVITYFEDYIVFNPITSFGTSVYENSLYLFDFYNTIMNYLGKYQVLFDDSVANYVYPDSINVKGLTLIPIDNNISEDDLMTIDNLRSEGYFHLNINNEFVQKLAKDWNTEIVSQTNNTVILKSDVDFGTRPELWFRNNLELVRNGQFPTMTLYGNWQFDLGGDYNDIYDKKWYKTILQYKALIAYKRLDEKDINLYIFNTKVNDDNSITVSLPTYDHVIRFRQIFESIDNDGIYTEPCSSFNDGVIKRDYVQGIDENSYSMVLKQDDEEVLVFRSPLINVYPPVFNFLNINQEVLENKLKQYYSKCNDHFEPVLQDISFDNLLNLVEINENGTTFCYSHNRQFIDKNIVLKSMMWEWGLRGLFTVNILKGLLNEFPSK